MKYSIITINYNNCDGLEKTIQSVINQSYQNFEFIIIDGGSTDSSVEVIKKYSNKIDYWISEPDKGIYHAMNKGIIQAHGEYLNFMNSGDLFYDNDVLKDISIKIDLKDIIIGKDFHYNANTKESFQTIFPTKLSMFTFFTGYLPHQSTFFKKELFQNMMYSEDYRNVSDWKFYIDKIIGENRSVSFIDRLVAWREQNGISSSDTNLVSKEREKVLKDFLPPGIWNDYNLLTKHLDRSTLEKLLIISDNSKAAYILKYIIKIIFRIIKK